MTQPIFGWLPPDQRTVEQAEIHEKIVLELGDFQLIKQTRPTEGKRTVLWDYTKAVNGGKHIPTLYQKTGSCFPAGTPVRMADGSEKPIEDVCVGDEVVTHTNAVRRVVDTMSRDYTGDMVTIRLKGFPFPLRMTADHQVATMTRRNRYESGKLSWVKANDLTQGDLGIVGYLPQNEQPTVLDAAQVIGDDAIILDDLMSGNSKGLNRPEAARSICGKHDYHGRVKVKFSRYNRTILRMIPVNETFARFIGLYLAEGGSHNGKVVLTFNANETDTLAAESVVMIRGIFGVEAKIVRSDRRPNTVKVIANNLALALFLKALIPGNVYSKRVPSCLMSANESVKMALLLGWIAGDGHEKVKENLRVTIVGVSACKGLARDMSSVAIDCGIRAGSRKRKARKQSKEAFEVSLSGDKILESFPALKAQAAAVGIKPWAKSAAVTQFGLSRPIVEIKRDSVQGLRVYDFEVEEDHSFIAGGIVVHNCVGQGAWNAVMYLMAMEIVRLGDAERVEPIFLPYHYGRGRLHAGIRGRGDGSTGSGQAKAVMKDGILTQNLEGLPKPSGGDGAFTWGGSVEMEWSDGARIADKWVAEGVKHPVKSAALVRTYEQVRDAIVNGYPVTVASMQGFQMATRKDKGKHWGVPSGQWAHQMCFIGVDDDPSRPGCYCQNSWSKDAHGPPADDAPPGGFWVDAEVVERMARQGDSFAYSQFDGFPEQLDFNVVR